MTLVDSPMPAPDRPPVAPTASPRDPLPVSPSAKVKPGHLARKAIVYVRQSTAQQVLNNRESTARQYALDQRAVQLGLPADQDGVYDPTQYNDRLLLGLKGTMSEAELHLLRNRMYEGLLNKARRGE